MLGVAVAVAAGACGASFGGDVVGSGATYAHTFTTSGEFPYICTIHADMSGTITVTP